MTISEDQLSNWTKPAFDNEDERRRNTESMISEAIRSHPLLKTLPITVYAKGSYKNNTNVRRDSDVDVAVEYTGIIYTTYADPSEQERIDQAASLGPYTGPFTDARGNTTIGAFKDAVGDALVGAFGSGAVTRHNKVFTVRESSRSLAADVVPCGTHRHYYNARSWAEGIRLLPDKATWPIDNYPQQHYDHGVAKNHRTSKRFKAVVRILKNLENRMVADGNSPEVASYLIECLVFNASDSCFGGYSWAQRVGAVLAYVWEDTEDPECEKRWVEVNDIKYLFHARQKWTRSEARDFVHAAWQYVVNS